MKKFLEKYTKQKNINQQVNTVENLEEIDGIWLEENTNVYDEDEIRIYKKEKEFYIIEK